LEGWRGDPGLALQARTEVRMAAPDRRPPVGRRRSTLANCSGVEAAYQPGVAPGTRRHSARNALDPPGGRGVVVPFLAVVPVSGPAATAACFEAVASTYERSALQAILCAPAHRAALRLAHRHMPRPRRVLDVGCGTARLLRQARPWYPQADLVGVDLAWAMLAAATAATPAALEICYLRACAERLPFTEDVFDLVLATLSVRHWTDLPGGLAEIGRVLSPGGVLVVADVFRACRRRPRVGLAAWRPRMDAPAEFAGLLAAQHLTVIGGERAPSLGLPDIQVIAAAKPGGAATVDASEPGRPARLQGWTWRAHALPQAGLVRHPIW
jgi:ubiquinone/menaquinone biosynthesis C-methylase UbiE